ncbi:hypothetical protein Misp01_68870 [Microtetraspora sp. NBRC 13810]|uniref:hypothetical protein n=1 Tax=Microtetraspora sp. NBRC 13810 TaxID=3030990 RepID=UPI0024A1F2EB|nr:hypothetical protein [Microtetraspora sp. NBRC 13810]GLW11759.1 hypothetical protein Misp01_68870 [Microtetraspora sp. NBRC 13810]
MREEAAHAAAGITAWEQAVIGTSRALVACFSSRDVTAARMVADETVRLARRSDSRILRAHALQAEMAARAGQDRHAFAALHLACHDIDANVDADPASRRFSPGYREVPFTVALSVCTMYPVSNSCRIRSHCSR